MYVCIHTHRECNYAVLLFKHFLYLVVSSHYGLVGSETPREQQIRMFQSTLFLGHLVTKGNVSTVFLKSVPQ